MRHDHGFDLAPKGAKGLSNQLWQKRKNKVLISPPKGQKGYEDLSDIIAVVEF